VILRRANGRSWLPVYPFTVVVVLISLLVTAGLSWSAHIVDDHTEDRLLRLKVAETGAALQAYIPQIQTTLTAAAAVSVASSDPVAGFRNYLSSSVGNQAGGYSSASLWQIVGTGAPRLVTVLGEPPQLGSRPSGTGPFLSQAEDAKGLQVIGLLSKPNRRLGYAIAGKAHRYVVYVESPLPDDGRVPVTSGSDAASLNTPTSECSSPPASTWCSASTSPSAIPSGPAT